MATAAVIALFVPSAVAGDPGSGGRAAHPVRETAEPAGGPEVRGGGGEQPAARWSSIAEDAPAPVAGLGRPGTGPPAFAARPGGEVLPVLPLGAGIACLGLGVGVFALRLRRA